MGSAFWIFVAIAVIQGIASVAAKSAEKKKKAARKAEIARDAVKGEGAGPVGKYRSQKELQEKLSDTGQAQKVIASMLGIPQPPTTPPSPPTPSAPDPVAETPRLASASQSRTELEEIRRRRLDAIRQRRAKQVAAQTAPPTPPPAAVSVPTASAPLAPMAASPKAPRANARGGRKERTSTRAESGSAARRGQAGPRSAITQPRSPHAPATKATTAGNGIPGLWRDPRSLRQAILLSELLQPPVALRNHQAGGH